MMWFLHKFTIRYSSFVHPVSRHLVLFALLIINIVVFSSCNTTKYTYRQIIKSIDNSEQLKNQFTGFVLFDLDKNKEIINYNGNKFFIPASNTKLFTFYTSLNVLNDSLPVVKYIQRNDTLIFWGTGNPLNLNPDFSKNHYTTEFINKNVAYLEYCDDNYDDDKYGPGWAWDDYLYYYQLEKSSFPILGNRLKISYSKDSVSIYPGFFKDNISFIQDSNEYWRPWDENNFVLGRFKDSTILEIPVITDDDFIKNALEHVTGKEIVDCEYTKTEFSELKVYQIAFPDSLYIRLLHDSDNFIAEQLMLMCSFRLFDTLNASKAIKWSKENLLPELTGNCRWVDGSGLSRYNLFSPEDMIYILKKIYDKLNWKTITYYFPSAGHSGTLKNSYNSVNTPYIWAKSGSFSNNYNLSGFIETNKGNRYIFSFMNNHFLKESKDIKLEMEKIFRYIYTNL